MRTPSLLFSAAILFHLATSSNLTAQTWKFVKTKDGTSLYTRQEKNSQLKSFRAEAIMRTDIEKISALIGNPLNHDWWGTDVSLVKVLAYEKEKHIRYYVVYDVPWPFTDRDMASDVVISKDTASGIRVVLSRPLPGVIPEKPGLIRITNFWQKWTLRPLNNGTVSVTLEGFVDPAGKVPAWLYNLVIIDSPLKLMREVEKRVCAK
jgi:hypothetical protein